MGSGTLLMTKVLYCPATHLGRWVVMVIVGLIVLVPLVACVHPVEVLGPSRAVLLMPPVRLQIKATRVSLR